MKTPLSGVVYSYLVLVGLTVGPVPAQQVVGSDVVAVVGDSVITKAALEDRAGDRLLRFKNDEFGIDTAVLNEYIDDLLLSQEAAKQKITVTELLSREVTDRVQPVTEAEARAVLDTASTYQRLPEAQALRAAMAEIRTRRTAKQRADYLSALRSQESVKIKLEPPRLHRSISGGQSSGPADAPVSIVEFSDFQCPYCANMATTLNRLRNEYSGLVRLVFKQMPLSIHPQAAKAAEASLCAANQGRFWEMHDRLFDQQTALAGGRFAELAEKVGLDVPAFENCLESQMFARVVNTERIEGVGVGITATPTFFINGRMIMGSRSYDELRKIVDEELKRGK